MNNKVFPLLYSYVESYHPFIVKLPFPIQHAKTPLKRELLHPSTRLEHSVTRLDISTQSAEVHWLEGESLDSIDFTLFSPSSAGYYDFRFIKTNLKNSNIFINTMLRRTCSSLITIKLLRYHCCSTLNNKIGNSKISNILIIIVTCLLLQNPRESVWPKFLSTTV